MGRKERIMAKKAEHTEEVHRRLGQGEVLAINPAGQIIDRDPSNQMKLAQELGLTRPVVFEEHQPAEYTRPFDAEVAMFVQGALHLGDMTPAYAWAMICADLKKIGSKAKTFTDEIAMAALWKEKLGELRAAFNLPEEHFYIDTTGPILHVHPLEESGKTISPSGNPLSFDMLRGGSQMLPTDVGRGFEAILPTHFQSSGYNTSAHPEMDSSMGPMSAIPRVSIGRYARIGGAFNVQGGETLKIGDNAWVGQKAYFITQEHPADLPSQLARVRQYTSFPGVTIGDWAWVAKEAKVLYRTMYVGEGSVIAAQAKVNSWVGDYSLVTDAGHNTFYPLKAFVLGALGIRDTAEVLSLDWNKVESLFQEKYEEWRKQDHTPDSNIAEALAELRENPRQRVLFIGCHKEANILSAANAKDGKNPLRRIDIMSHGRGKQAFIMQALNGMRAMNVRFRNVEDLGNIPIGEFYEEPLYDMVVVQTSAADCCEGGHQVCKIFEEASRLVKPGGRIIGTLHDVDRHRDGMRLPEYVNVVGSLQNSSDTMAVHAQRVASGTH